MQDQEFESYVRLLERRVRAHPVAYRAGVLALGALGYLYVITVLVALTIACALLVGLLAGRGGTVIALKLLVPVAGFVWMIARALWVTIPAPQGIPLRRADAPQLFGCIDEICLRLRAPRAHRVLLTDEVNASVTQVPRLGLFGWPRNYLCLGLPLLGLLTEEQARAVIAHEFGHLSGAHGRSGAWIYRIRVTWMRIHQALSESRQAGDILFLPFFRWYAPRFSAYSFVLVREQEFEADRDAVRLTHAGALGTALARLALGPRFENGGFWNDIWRRARAEPRPPARAFRELAAGLRAAPDHARAVDWLESGLQQPADPADTHPSLTARLQAIGVPADPAWLLDQGRGQPTAAEAWLGDAAAAYLDRMNARWSEQVGEHWAREHEALTRLAARLAELAARSDLTHAEARERALSSLQLEGDDAALPLLRELVERTPDDPECRLAMGEILLRKGEDDGLRHLDAAMDAGIDQVPAGCAAAIAFLERGGRSVEAEPYRERLERYRTLMKLVGEERAASSLNGADTFLPHGLESGQIEEIVRVLAGENRVSRGYLARKAVQHLPDRPLHVLGLVCPSMRKVVDPSGTALVHRVLDALPHAGDVIVLILAGEVALERKLSEVAGAEVYVWGRTAG